MDDHATPSQWIAAAPPPLPPTAKPDAGENALGGPKDKPSKSKVVLDGTGLQDTPSKCNIVPESPAAQPFDCPNRTTEFSLFVVGGEAANVTGTIIKPNNRRTAQAFCNYRS